MTLPAVRSNTLPERRDETVTIENARILFKPNFAGAEEQFNREGDRYFNVELTEEQADEMARLGWNVKTWTGKQEDDETRYFLKVKVSYKFRPPRLVLITSRGRIPLDEETCEMLDWTEFEFIDVILSPSKYTMNGRAGISAYIKTGMFVVREDELEQKYSHLPEIGMDPILALPPGEDGDVIDVEGEWVEDEPLAIEA